jgi:hypothetical protein
LNLAHACFIVGVGVLATIQFAPHQKFDAWKSKDFGISLLGDNKITAFWRSAIRPEGPPKTWVPIKNLDGNYVVLGWYVKIPGVQHVVTTVPFSAGVGSDKAGVHVHGLKVSPAVAALPAGLYLLVALLFYLPSSRGKPCRKCGYNLRGEAGPTCPGCKEPTNPSMEAGQ